MSCAPTRPLPCHEQRLEDLRRLAADLARSGAHGGWPSVESALQRLGHPDAREALSDDAVRAELDALCLARAGQGHITIRFSGGGGPAGERHRFSYRLTAAEEMPGLIVVRVAAGGDAEGRFPVAALNFIGGDAEAALRRAAARLAAHHQGLEAHHVPPA